MKFTEYLLESLNTSFDITKQSKTSNVYFYYFSINNIEYRIFIEEVLDEIGNHLHVGFERKIDGDWEISPITNDLNAKDVLSLFGTIKKIIMSKEFDSLYMVTDSDKKLQLYHNMAVKLNREMKIGNVSRDDKSVLIYENKKPNLKNKIKYKK